MREERIGLRIEWTTRARRRGYQSDECAAIEQASNEIVNVTFQATVPVKRINGARRYGDTQRTTALSCGDSLR